ncbi:hypothetical protein FRC05_001670 [Tulasnella sp. 425]|nr:hypothetical protein FRC05_001670 [Tulasnella sp. 425]
MQPCANCGDPHTADNHHCKARAEATKEAKASNPKPDLSGLGNPSAPKQGTRATNAHNNSESQGGQKRQGERPAPKGKKIRKTSEADTSAEGEMEVELSVEGANAQ